MSLDFSHRNKGETIFSGCPWVLSFLLELQPQCLFKWSGSGLIFFHQRYLVVLNLNVSILSVGFFFLIKVYLHYIQVSILDGWTDKILTRLLHLTFICMWAWYCGLGTFQQYLIFDPNTHPPHALPYISREMECLIVQASRTSADPFLTIS